jgi:hypothetical protein
VSLRFFAPLHLSDVLRLGTTILNFSLPFINQDLNPEDGLNYHLSLAASSGGLLCHMPAGAGAELTLPCWRPCAGKGKAGEIQHQLVGMLPATTMFPARPATGAGRRASPGK